MSASSARLSVCCCIVVVPFEHILVLMWSLSFVVGQPPHQEGGEVFPCVGERLWRGHILVREKHLMEGKESQVGMADLHQQRELDCRSKRRPEPLGVLEHWSE